MPDRKTREFAWRRKNCVLIIGLSIISGLKYLLDYEGSFVLRDHDGLLTFFIAIIFSIICLCLFIISVYKGSGISSFISLLCAGVQMLIIFSGNTVEDIGKAGLITNVTVIAAVLAVLKFQFDK